MKLIALLFAAFFLSSCATVNVASRDSQSNMSIASHVGAKAVKLIALEGGSGSGVILKSTPRGSLILTNMHVCEPLMASPNGGYVVHKNKRIKIAYYKVSKVHDICMVLVRRDLGVETKLAKRAPKKFDNLINPGHPNGLPLVISEGRTSERMNISIMYGWVPCDGSEVEMQDVMDCIMNQGHKPDIRTMDSLLVASLSAPGSSGSGVFNEAGELVGLVFAGRGRSLSYSFNVPYEYIYAFLHDEVKTLKWQKSSKKKSSESDKTKFLPMPQVLGVIN